MSKEWFYDFFERDYFVDNSEDQNRSEELSTMQVDFLTDVLEANQEQRILDLCCGNGRHALILARKGYNVIGFDLCEKALKLARHKAQMDKLCINLVMGDMRYLPFKNEFHIVYNYFNSFGYFENDLEDMKVLKGIVEVLKSGGKFLIERSNFLLVLRNFQERVCEDGPFRKTIHENSYDEKSKRLKAKWTFIYKDTGESREYHTIQRFYSVEEFTSMLNSIGMKILNVYGDIDKVDYNPDSSKRIIILAQKI